MAARKKRKKTKGTPTSVLVGGSVIAFLVLWALTPDHAFFKQKITWQRLTEPGALSKAHSSLDYNCAACHTSLRGVGPSDCIVCHANNEPVLQRQPTAFHASISSCTECHLEHQGIGRRPTMMDHEALAKIGLRQLNGEAPDSDEGFLREELLSWTSGLSPRLSPRLSPPHSRITATEMALDCATCHANDDRHFDLFGQECAECHATDRWTIPEFLHPSVSSMDCAQCHQAPPSHYMMHFKMISASVAAKPHARVDQCFECHQSTSWPDIKGVGWYKHH